MEVPAAPVRAKEEVEIDDASLQLYPVVSIFVVFYSVSDFADFSNSYPEGSWRSDNMKTQLIMTTNTEPN